MFWPLVLGNTHGHDAIPVEAALEYFKERGFPDYSMIYSKTKAAVSPYLYLGTRKEVDANYIMLGESVNMVLDGTSKEVAASMIMVIDRFYWIELGHSTAASRMCIPSGIINFLCGR